MSWLCKRQLHVAVVMAFSMFIFGAVAKGQNRSLAVESSGGKSETVVGETTVNTSTVKPTIAHYFDPVRGLSSDDLVRRALASNGELAAARIEIERARGRLRQAGL